MLLKGLAAAFPAHLLVKTPSASQPRASMPTPSQPTPAPHPTPPPPSPLCTPTQPHPPLPVAAEAIKDLSKEFPSLMDPLITERDQ